MTQAPAPLLLGFGSSGSATPPDAPSLTVADDGDGTGVTATVADSTAGSTNEIYYQAVDGELGGDTWTSGGSRSGDGTIAVTLSTGFYWFYVLSTKNGLNAVSNFAYQNATSGNDAVHKQILDAVQTRIQGLSLSTVSGDSIVVQKLPYSTRFGTAAEVSSGDKDYALPGIIVSMLGTENIRASEGTNAQDDIGYPVLVAIVADDTTDGVLDLEDNINKYLLWRQKITKAFRNQRLPGVTEVYTCQIEPGPTINPDMWNVHGRLHSTFVVRCITRETRGVS